MVSNPIFTPNGVAPGLLLNLAVLSLAPAACPRSVWVRIRGEDALKSLAQSLAPSECAIKVAILLSFEMKVKWL